MMKIFAGFIDRMLFAIGVLALMQLPNFIDQYTQRIGGYYSAEKTHLEKYQSIADDNYAGNIEALISDFKGSSKNAISQTGADIEATLITISDLKDGLAILENHNLPQKIFYLLTNTDINLAKGTMNVFRPGIPFSMDAAICGVLGGILFSLTFNGLIKLPRLLFFRSSAKKIIHSQ